MANILYLSPIVPLPPEGGAYLRSYNTLLLLERLSYKIIAIVPTECDLKYPHKLRNTSFYKCNFHKISGGSLLNKIKNLFVINNDIAVMVQSIIKKNNFEFAFFDYGYIGQYISFIKEKGIPVIYGTHNFQSQLDKNLAKNTITGFGHFCLKRFHEKKYFKRANLLLTVSENDKLQYAKILKKLPIYVLPNFVDEEECNKNFSKEDYIVFSGNFYAIQNQEGLEWFLINIWDKILSNRIKLIIVGLNSDKYLLEIKKNKNINCENILVLGKVYDIKPIIGKAKISIVPILSGSGTRLKCIEAMALKTQLVSTSVGAEGIEHNGSILVADDPIIFRESILNVIDGKMDTTQYAYNIFLEKYSFNANKNLLKTIIMQSLL